MIQELLMSFACIHNTGCSQTSTLYYTTHPEITGIIQKNEDKAAKIVGAPPQVVIYTTPALIYIVGGQASFKLNQYFSLQIKRSTNIVSFRYNF